MHFSKYNGAGNDYVFINGDKYPIKDYKDFAVEISNRNFGIGSDGLVLYGYGADTDLKMRIFNADGSEGGTCGNALRCLGEIYKNEFNNRLPFDKITVETKSGIAAVETAQKGYRVLVGKPKLFEKDVCGYFVDIGNPHCVILASEIDNSAKKRAQKISKKHDVNVEIIRLIDENNFEMFVYERGSGVTLSCGSGAAASAFVLKLLGYGKDKMCAKLLGGSIYTEVTDAGVYIEGNVNLNFVGEYFRN